MKVLLLMGLLCLSLPCLSQKIKKEEYDPYFKSKVVETTWERLGVTFTRAVNQRIRTSGDRKYLQLGIHLMDVFRVDEGDVLYLLLENNETVELRCFSGGVADYHMIQNLTWWTNSPLYKISSTEIDKLTTHLCVGVRITMGGEYVTFEEIKEKHAKKLQKALKLIAL